MGYSPTQFGNEGDFLEQTDYCRFLVDSPNMSCKIATSPNAMPISTQSSQLADWAAETADCVTNGSSEVGPSCSVSSGLLGPAQYQPWMMMMMMISVEQQLE
jgi:hypothetical protein